MTIDLSFKTDWADAQRRHIAWWNHDIVDRVCLGITARKKDPAGVPPQPERGTISPEEYYLNEDLRIAEIEAYMASTVFLGEAFPNASVDLGPGSLALYVGSMPGYAWDTIWFEPWPAAAEGALPEYDPYNPIWVKHQQMLSKLAAAGKGRYLANIPDLVEALDIVAALRGVSETLYDLFDRPEWIHACQERLVGLYFKYYERCYELCKQSDGGVAFTAFQVWAPGRMAKLQCDFSAMISPEMYAEFQLPYLRRICQGLEYSVYHWDGPSAIPQLDNLLSIPELNAIQWTPGAGQGEVWDEQWYPNYKKVIDAGKSLLLLGPYDAEGMDRLMKKFGPRGFYMFCWAPDEDTGRSLLTHAEKHWK